MPLYTFECPEHHRFDDLRSVTEGASATCPTCSQEAHRVPPDSFTAKVLEGTPLFYPHREHV